MKTLVVGATGYVGRALCARLADAEPLPRVDLTDLAQARAALTPWRWEAIVNAAGPAPKGVQSWDEARETIVGHTRIAMNLARSVPPDCRLVHVSGMLVYGLPETQPVLENHPRRPIHAYGLAKLLSEDALASHRDVWMLRCGGIFSADRTEGALYHFLRAAKRSEPLRVTATSPLVWDVIHLDDVVEAIVRALAVPGQGPLNVSTGEPIDLVGMARRIARRFGGQVENVGAVDHPVYQADISAMRRAFDWQPAPLDRRLDAWWERI